jgi:hypothetical protein
MQQVTLIYHSSNAETPRILAMHPTAITTTQTTHQRRLRESVKRLVIELGYLEHRLTAGRQDTHLETDVGEGFQASSDKLFPLF